MIHIYRSYACLFGLLLLLLLPFSIITTAEAREVEGIAAIVNDEVISFYDVDQRVNLALATSGFERTPEVVERIRTQVLRSLVDEKLQLQEAERVEIAVDEKEVDSSIDRLAEDNSMTRDGIQEFLAENEISIETLRNQVRAELAWSQFVRRSFGGRVTIGDGQIEEQYRRTLQAIDQPRYLLGEILLRTDGLSDETRTRQLSDTIIRQLRSGVEFAAVARQFSVSPSASNGGQLGWVGADQLNPTLSGALSQMQPGQISSPIITPAGVYILALQDRRIGTKRDAMQDRIAVLSIRYPKETPAATIAAFRTDFKTCNGAETRAEKDGAQSTRSALVPLAQVPNAIRSVLSTMDAGTMSEAREHTSGIDLLIVCDRKDDQGIIISRDDIADNIYSQRVSMLARRHLRDLRRDAVVDYR